MLLASPPLIQLRLDSFPLWLCTISTFLWEAIVDDSVSCCYFGALLKERGRGEASGERQKGRERKRGRGGEWEKQ